MTSNLISIFSLSIQFQFQVHLIAWTRLIHVLDFNNSANGYSNYSKLIEIISCIILQLESLGNITKLMQSLTLIFYIFFFMYSCIILFFVILQCNG